MMTQLVGKSSQHWSALSRDRRRACEEQPWEKERIFVSTSSAHMKGQNFGSAVYLIPCYVGDKGTGMMKVSLGDETSF